MLSITLKFAIKTAKFHDENSYFLLLNQLSLSFEREVSGGINMFL